MSSFAPLHPGQILHDRYRVHGVIGQGGMGSVYMADDLRLEGRITAIKEIHLNPADPPALREQNRRQFQREASTLARLDHPNLPKVSDFFEEFERDFLVMDFVPGHDLKSIIENTALKGEFLPFQQVLQWAQQIAQTLQYLHAQTPPVLHRDIKPSNLKLTPDDLIKLVDFGLVKTLASDEERTITVVQGRGSALYTPLEQYGGDTGHTDVRSDLYAFGATLYQLFTNQPPASAKDRFLNPRSLAPISEIRPDLPQHVVAAVHWALEMHPDDRPQRIEVLYEALMGNLDTPQHSPVQAKGSTPEEPTLNNVPLLALVLGLLLLAVVVTLYAPVQAFIP